MPFGDGSGPAGMGPVTGRGLGYCTGNNAPGCYTPGPGLGRGYGRGLGRGMGYYGRGRAFRGGSGYYPQYPVYPAVPVNNVYPAAPADEKAALQNQYDMLMKEAENLKDRINKLD